MIFLLQYSSWRSGWVDCLTCKRENVLLHFKHGIFWISSLVCASICFLRFGLRVKALGQILHLKGFSPVCFLVCLLRSLLSALVWPLPCVRHHVVLQKSSCNCGEVTLCTLMWLKPWVSHHMTLQIIRSLWCIVTLCAYIWLLSCVVLYVYFHGLFGN